jgi:hypothetical protein
MTQKKPQKKKRYVITVSVNELYISDYQSFKLDSKELKIAVPKNFEFPVSELKIAKKTKEVM